MSCTSIAGICLALLFSQPQLAIAASLSIGAARDSTIYSSAAGDLSNGAGQFLFAGTIATAPAARRGLLAFDVAGALPAGAIINSVNLRLHMSRTISGPHDASLHRVTQNWGEGTSNATGQEGMGAPATNGDATWPHALWPGTPWTTLGGDFVAASSALISVGGNGFYTWGSTPEMVADVQSWLDSPSGNFGWLVRVDESILGTAKRFGAREHPTPTNRPLLTIEHTPVPEPTTITLTLWIALAAVEYPLRRWRT